MEEFKRCLLVLASESKVQDSLYPDFTCKGDEMVLDFEAAIEDLGLDSFAPEQQGAFKKLDTYLIEHSGEKFESHYLDNNAIYTSEVWSEIRILAKNTLLSFGWEYEIPKSNGAIYVANNET